MSETRYCHKCGVKVMTGSLFCHNCGAKIVNEETNVDNANIKVKPVNTFQKQYIEIINEKVLFAYLNSVSVDIQYLYRNSSMYQFTNKMVDKYVNEYQNKINILKNYLSQQYNDGNYLMLDIDDDTINETINYANNLGFDNNDEINLIIKKYIGANKINEKNELLQLIIEHFSIDGTIDYDLIDEYNINKEQFKNKELKRLLESIEKIEKVQIEFYKNSNKIELTNSEYRKLYEIGYSLGFKKKQQIAFCILGIDKKNGYTDKKDEFELQKKIKSDINHFSLLERSIVVNGKEIKFEGGFFLFKFVTRYIHRHLQLAKIEYDNTVKKLNVKDDDFSDDFVDAMLEVSSLIRRVAVAISIRLELDNYESQPFIDSFEEIRKAFVDDIYDCRSIFDKLDDSVKTKELKNQIRKDNRDRWQMIGFGVSGGIQAGITQSMMNAGTGLVYDAMNGISKSMTKHKVINAKEEILENLHKVMEEYFKDTERKIVEIFFKSLRNIYPYCVWQPNEKQFDELFNHFANEKDINKKIEYAYELLHEDPRNKKAYVFLFSILLKNISNNNVNSCNSLLKLFKWFHSKDEYVAFVSKGYSSSIKFLQNNYKIEDLETINRLNFIENCYDYFDKEEHDKVCSKHLKYKLKKLKEYEPKEVNQLINYFDTFDSGCEYSANKERDYIIDKVMFSKGVVYDSKDPIELQNSLNILNSIKNTYKLDFNHHINEISNSIKGYLSKESIENYNLRNKEFITIPIELDNVYKIKDFDGYTKNIKSLCQGLNCDNNIEEWNKSLEPIIELCNHYEYGKELPNKLNEQYKKYQVDIRTVYGFTYKTLDEANFAKKEMDFINSLYKNVYDDNDKIDCYKKLSKCNFRSSSAIKALAEHEKELIRNYDRSKVSYAGETIADLFKSIGFLLLSLVLTALFLIFVLDFKWYIILICALIVIACWSTFVDKLKDFFDDLSSSHKGNSFVRKFKRNFKISNNHITLKK